MVSTSNKRKEKDLMKLMMSNYEVTLTEENSQNEFFVIFYGPKETPYEEVHQPFILGSMEN
jgi:ubiquitin-conjugating enzyme E2 H